MASSQANCTVKTDHNCHIKKWSGFSEKYLHSLHANWWQKVAALLQLVFDKKTDQLLHKRDLWSMHFKSKICGWYTHSFSFTGLLNAHKALFQVRLVPQEEPFGIAVTDLVPPESFRATAQFLPWSATFVQLRLILGCFGANNLPFWENVVANWTSEHP